MGAREATEATGSNSIATAFDRITRVYPSRTWPFDPLATCKGLCATARTESKPSRGISLSATSLSAPYSPPKAKSDNALQLCTNLRTACRRRRVLAAGCSGPPAQEPAQRRRAVRAGAPSGRRSTPALGGSLRCPLTASPFLANARVLSHIPMDANTTLAECSRM